MSGQYGPNSNGSFVEELIGTTKARYAQVLEEYLNSPAFKEGVIASTKAGYLGDSYSVELFSDGTWRNLHTQTIGNRYESEGVLLVLPSVPDVSEDELEDAFDLERDELEQDMKDRLQDRWSV